MIYSTATLLRLTKAVLLVATLLGYCASLPAVSRPRPSMMMDMETSKAPKLKQLQEASQSTATRTHQFPANSIDSLERDMREAETTTTAEVMAETTPSVASGDGSSDTDSTTAPAQNGESDSTSTQTARTERSPSSRDQFKEIVRTYYTTPHTGGTEELASFFSISEMYRVGPLATDSRVDNPPSTSFIDNSRNLCLRMVDRLNTQRSTSDFCHWTYTCNYNENRFPSMIVNATQCTAAHGAKCVQRVTEVQTFTRTFVGNEPTWRRDDELASVVYAYTCRQRHEQ